MDETKPTPDATTSIPTPTEPTQVPEALPGATTAVVMDEAAALTPELVEEVLSLAPPTTAPPAPLGQGTATEPPPLSDLERLVNAPVAPAPAASADRTPRLLDLLKSLEWSGPLALDFAAKRNEPTCPRCHALKPAGHADGCDLAAEVQ